MPTITKTVDIEIDEDELYDAIDDCERAEVAENFLDCLVDRGVVMSLSPFMRNQLLSGAADLRSVLV